MRRRALMGLFLLPLARAQGACRPTPALTEGPYYLREVPQRSDLREGLPGVPLRLTLKVQNAACRPLGGARVDLWHTDALGRYSGVNAPGTFCRGWQATDEKGEVAFLTLFPGWYPSRTPHLHLRVEAGGRGFATQLFFPEEAQRQVYAQPPYAQRGLPRVGNRQDGIFRADLLLTLRPEGEGFAAAFTLTLPF
ncbi:MULTISPECIES: intradiol ring-cleavage dioxygenase [Thermus]|jgi:protocatechuate 3,4-dioxygenase beta subunit|uniref:Catechol 1,2-dioxygenase n=1 Tax=Thermus brockianus TaxID=56956 RepID=A0A1J0LRS1_THEBO|nr:intradiol ring-cleavage dioxygenase [Thermus brockianus]APD08976.1 catechol 1,2-dioxygenase [Thermus brockianus]BDG15594.1 catechol 1,2-dioxygenase [Thermus brockianus]